MFHHHQSFKELQIFYVLPGSMCLSYEKERPQVFLQTDTNLSSISSFIQGLENFS